VKLATNLSRQLFRSVIVIYFMITLTVTALHVIIEYFYTESHISEELKITARTFEPALRMALWDMNDEQLRSIAKAIYEMPLVYGVEIFDPNGKALVTMYAPELDTQERKISHEIFIHATYNDNKIYLARVVIYSDDHATFNRIKVGFLMIFLNALIKSAALVLLFFFAFRKHLQRPLHELIQKIQQLDPAKRERIKISPSGDNELAFLQKSFNELLERIETEERHRSALESQLREELEEKVRSRTTELEAANSKLQKLATTDALTQLFNRAKLTEVLQRCTSDFEKNAQPLSLILMDIDFFKLVNDNYGHQTGDTVLRQFATILSEYVRGVDTVGRWGGEEFLIICDNTDGNGAYMLAEKLRGIINSFSFHEIGQLTASFGVAQLTEGMDTQTLIKATDDALYLAKSRGRNITVLADTFN